MEFGSPEYNVVKEWLEDHQQISEIKVEILRETIVISAIDINGQEFTMTFDIESIGLPEITENNRMDALIYVLSDFDSDLQKLEINTDSKSEERVTNTKDEEKKVGNGNPEKSSEKENKKIELLGLLKESDKYPISYNKIVSWYEQLSLDYGILFETIILNTSYINGSDNINMDIRKL